jgi:cell fate regulator YaaT (PSP1 superfamily)
MEQPEQNDKQIEPDQPEQKVEQVQPDADQEAKQIQPDQPDQDDRQIAGIKFENSSKIYGFKVDDIELKNGDRVVVESDLGMSLGKVVSTDFGTGDPQREAKPVLRKASEEDLAKLKENEGHKQEAQRFCIERIMARGLPMKLIQTDTTLDRKRYIFYFVAETRIDFRELVKDLASKFRTRIELRQIGIRDAAMLTGGIGVCGREFCCKRFLKGFAPISIKMAKKQDLVLNTIKLSGACGRLMCCLNYEYEDYKKRKLEKIKEREEAKLAEEIKEIKEAADAIKERAEAREKPEDKAPHGRKHEAKSHHGRKFKAKSHHGRKHETKSPEGQKPEAKAPHGQKPEAKAQERQKQETSAQETHGKKKKRWRRRRKKKK